MTELAERITVVVLEVLKKGGDNLAIYEAVRSALASPPEQPATAPRPWINAEEGDMS